MNRLHVKYLLVRGGPASSSAAQAIRALDRDGSVLLVGQEINRPYHRPPLSKSYLRRLTPREALYTVEPGWFEVNHVELRTARRVSRIDAARSAAMLDSGEEVSFDHLLLATGATPLPLTATGSRLPNVFYLRNLADDAALHNAIEKAKHEGRKHANGRGRAAVIGAGTLGVELAGTLTQLGLAVDLVASRAYPWNRLAGENVGRFLTRYLQKHGVTVHTDAPAQRLEGDGRVQRVVLEARAEPVTLDCDLVVAAVGAAANMELLRGTPISAGRAILVDDHCRTSVPNIYAAGDCCSVFDPLFGKHRWIDQWDNAAVTGALAGRNMAGASEAYAGVSTFFSDVFDLSIKGWGEPRLVDRRLLRGTPNVDAPDFVEIGVAADGRIAQVLSVGHQGEDGLLRDLVARRVRVDGNEESLKDPASPLTGFATSD